MFILLEFAIATIRGRKGAPFLCIPFSISKYWGKLIWLVKVFLLNHSRSWLCPTHHSFSNFQKEKSPR
ncbi:hypothetical protein, partial [Streptococcus suis]|uniref:hypothetical protein n=1 Tax=Streptococcus suis TaxID=1307 RepID=UPI0038B8AD37